MIPPNTKKADKTLSLFRKLLESISETDVPFGFSNAPSRVAADQADPLPSEYMEVLRVED